MVAGPLPPLLTYDQEFRYTTRQGPFILMFNILWDSRPCDNAFSTPVCDPARRAPRVCYVVTIESPISHRFNSFFHYANKYITKRRYRFPEPIKCHQPRCNSLFWRTRYNRFPSLWPLAPVDLAKNHEVMHLWYIRDRSHYYLLPLPDWLMHAHTVFLKMAIYKIQGCTLTTEEV